MNLLRLYPNLVYDSYTNIGNDSPQGFPLTLICPGTVHLLSGSTVVLKLSQQPPSFPYTLTSMSQKLVLHLNHQFQDGRMKEKPYTRQVEALLTLLQGDLFIFFLHCLCTIGHLTVLNKTRFSIHTATNIFDYAIIFK